MRENEVFSRQELARESGIPMERVEVLEKEGIFSPSGLTAGEVPFYREDKIQEVRKIVQLLDLGYGPAEVRKIVERVGVPGARPGRESRGVYLTVGELAEKSGIGVRTLKHWEDKGILAPDTRSDGGFRLYRNPSVRMVKLIRDLQLFGFKLEEIKEVADMIRLFDAIKAGSSGLGEEEALEQLAGMTEKMKAMREHTDRLKEGLRRWERLLDERRRDVSRLRDRLRKSRGEGRKASKKAGPRSGTKEGPSPVESQPEEGLAPDASNLTDTQEEEERP